MRIQNDVALNSLHIYCYNCYSKKEVRYEFITSSIKKDIGFVQ